MGSYIYENELNNLESSLNYYYKDLLIENANKHASVFQYNYVEMVETETITPSEKTTKLRDLTISKLIDESCDIDEIDSQIELINNIKVEDEEEDFSAGFGGTSFGGGEVNVSMMSKIIPKRYFDIEVQSFEYMDMVLQSFIKSINEEVIKLIKGIEEVDVNNKHELHKVQYKCVENNRSGVSKYGISSLEMDGFKLNRVDIGGSEKFIIVPQNKPFVFMIQDISCIQSMNFGTSYRIRITYFMDLIAEPEECKIVNLTDQFFNTLIL